jgi:hypothetical protein
VGCPDRLGAQHDPEAVGHQAVHTHLVHHRVSAIRSFWALRKAGLHGPQCWLDDMRVPSSPATLSELPQ